MTTFENQWETPPADYVMDYRAVHVWRGCLPSTFACGRAIIESLSMEEIKKAKRYIRKSDQNRYIFAHAMLRSILSAYIECGPQQLKFEADSYGKPFLAGPGDYKEVQFNLSHSEDVALFAVSRGARVGIDVEHVRSVPDARQIVERFFSADERNFLCSLPPADFQEAFFACWSSKEALLKGVGKGLSYPLNEFSILLSKENPDCLLQLHDSAYSNCWKVMRLFPAPGYSGALAIEERASEAKYFQWHPI